MTTSFTSKSWHDGSAGGTPLSAAALVDLETRLASFADTRASEAVSAGGGSQLTPNGGDDTAALTAAIGVGSRLTTLGVGTFSLTTATLASGLHLKGAGKTTTTLLTSGPASAQSAILNGGTATNVLVEDLTIDGNDHANAALGAYFASNGVFKNVTFRNVRFRNFTTTNGIAAVGQGCGFYAWTADGVALIDCEFEDCNYPIFADNPGPRTIIRGNHIWANSGVTSVLLGITLKYNSTTVADSLVEGNTVENIKADPSAAGVYGHGINIIRCQGVRVLGNTTNDTTCAGIHIGDGSYGTKTIGNTIRNAAQTQAIAIYVELNIGDTNIAVGSDGRLAGAIVQANTVITSGSYGIGFSYSAGSQAIDNNISQCQYEAIFCDSDRCTIARNVCYDNYLSNAAPSPGSTPNVKAQIRVTTGSHCGIADNQVFTTNLAGPVATYAIAAADNNHTITGNDMTGGGLTSGLYVSGRTTIFVDGSNVPPLAASVAALPTVASGATVTLPVQGDVFFISGTTNITSVTASWAGRRVMLIFTGTNAGTGLTDGSNLKLGSNYVWTPDDTISLVCDGTNWYETARSAN